MPPKRTKPAKNTEISAANEELEEDDEGGESIATRKKSPSAPRRGKAHEALAVLVDVGRTSVEGLAGEESDLDRSKQIVDWVLSRKVALKGIYMGGGEGGVQCVFRLIKNSHLSTDFYRIFRSFFTNVFRPRKHFR